MSRRIISMVSILGLALAQQACYINSPMGVNMDWYQNTNNPTYNDATVAPPGTPTNQLLIAGMAPDYIISNYDLIRSTVQSQLLQMRQNGATIIRLILWYTRNANLMGQTNFNLAISQASTCSGSSATRTWLMDSTGGALPSACITNLQNYIADVKAAGFKTMIIAMGPEYDNSWFDYGGSLITGTWPATTWQTTAPWNSYYNEDKTLTIAMHSIFLPHDTGGFFIWEDPWTECVNNMTVALQVCGQLWADYVGAVGLNYTLGFSMIPGLATEHVTVYNGVLPSHGIDLHLYGPAETSSGWSKLAADYQSQFVTEYSADTAAGLSGPVMVSETICCEPQIILGLQQGATQTGATLLGILPWPLRYDGTYYNAPLLFWKQY